MKPLPERDLARLAEKAVDQIDDALQIERKARIAMMAIGEQWRLSKESGPQLTEEERDLHEHLVRHWQRAARELDQLRRRPLRYHS
jgi:methanogenic corrinoid protein MtbC1